MENTPVADDTIVDHDSLSYDDTVAYEEQLPPPSDRKPAPLANRIGQTKIYLLPESSVARVGKRKHEDEETSPVEDVIMDDEDSTLRSNALLFHGPPISHLPTARLFAYATNFDTHPLGLEWVDDATAIFVFDTKSAARAAWQCLQRSSAEETDLEGFVSAKSIPVALWTPEERINKSLGTGEGLKGTIKMRWARVDDVKKKGAKSQSEFYRKHGVTAGKDLQDDGGMKRRRLIDEEDEIQQKAQLDSELEAFLAEDSEENSVIEQPSKMRSDYIGVDGRTTLEHTPIIRASPMSLESRITTPPRRRDGRARYKRNMDIKDHNGVGVGGQNRRPKKSQQELDDELDAFLSGRS